MGEKVSAKEQSNFKPSWFCIGRRSERIYKILSSKRPWIEYPSGLKTYKEIDRRIDEIKTAEQLEPLTVDEEMEPVRLQRSGTVEYQYKSLLQEKKPSRCQMKAEKKEEWEESLKKAEEESARHWLGR